MVPEASELSLVSQELHMAGGIKGEEGVQPKRLQVQILILQPAGHFSRQLTPLFLAWGYLMFSCTRPLKEGGVGSPGPFSRFLHIAIVMGSLVTGLHIYWQNLSLLQ
jgi:hypothetical protein